MIVFATFLFVNGITANNLTVAMIVLYFSCPFTLKIDCEGCEYAAIPPLFDLISSGKASVNQVLIELHSKSPQILYDFFLAADRVKLRRTHKERNQWGCYRSRCVEYAFVSEASLRKGKANVAMICPAISDN